MTIIELADEIGWPLPDSDPGALQAWFTAGAAAKDLMQSGIMAGFAPIETRRTIANRLLPQ